MPTTPDVIVTGALATKVSNIAPFRHAAESIAGEMPVYYVHGGVPNDEGGFDVATPSQQEAQITEIIEQHPDHDFLILSQSMGALSALSCIEKFDSEHVRAISASPPLLHPSEVLRSSRIMTRSHYLDDGRLVLPSYSFALGDSGPGAQPPVPFELPVPQELYEEIDAIDTAYRERTLNAIRKGALKIVMPTKDWNESGLTASRDLPEVYYLDGPHSLITDEKTLKKNVLAITHLAQALFSH